MSSLIQITSKRTRLFKPIIRLRMVKNINFFWVSKKIFLKNCILGHWTFLYKMNFFKKCHFLPEKCFFLTKNAIYTLVQPHPTLMSRNFFSIGIVLLKFWRICWRKVAEMVKPPSEHFQFSQKWTIFGRFEKSFQKRLEPYT